ncbi:MAG TPA: hypothetical protein VG963_02160, partial [Polyangiaceae bacterium]|nr:hypothetical protein [Polyangiaceae bacterium]
REGRRSFMLSRIQAVISRPSAGVCAALLLSACTDPRNGVEATAEAPLSCAERTQVVSEGLARLYEIDRSCHSNEDCGFAPAHDGCPVPTCNYVVSREHEAEVARVTDAIFDQCDALEGDGCGADAMADACNSIEGDGCGVAAAEPICRSSGSVACIRGQCVKAWDPCETQRISWTNANTADGYETWSITGCDTLHVDGHYHNFGGGPDITNGCSVPLTCMGEGGLSGKKGMADVQNALGDPKLQAALASAKSFTATGVDLTNVSIDAGAWSLNSCSAAEIDTGACKPAPASVRAFLELLVDIQQLYSCAP